MQGNNNPITPSTICGCILKSAYNPQYHQPSRDFVGLPNDLYQVQSNLLNHGTCSRKIFLIIRYYYEFYNNYSSNNCQPLNCTNKHSCG